MEWFDLESMVKLLVAAALGAAVGLEREIHGRPAGLRTNALVSLASCLLIVITRSGALQGLAGPDNFLVNMDPARMAAGIVTGIGFLGAGTILRLRQSLVRGLTTAAGLWFVAAAGIAVGLGEYALAGMATLLALMVLWVMGKLEIGMGNQVDRTLAVVVDQELSGDCEARCRELIAEHGIRLGDVGYDLDNDNTRARLTFALRASRANDTAALPEALAKAPGVHRVVWS